MRIQVGQLAPDVQTTDVFGRPLSLQSLRGRPVLLSFYRYASCPVCNLRVRDLRQAAPALEALGLAVVGVFQSDAAGIGRYVGRQEAPFPLVADPGLVLYRRYGVERGWAAMLRWPTIAAALRAFAAGFLPGRIDGPVDRTPADFLIDRDGRVVIAHYGRHLSDHVSIAALEAALGAPAAARPQPVG